MSNLAIMIDESPIYDPIEGTESMSYVVFIGEDCFDCHKFTRFSNLDAAYDYALELHEKHPQYVFEGMI